MGARPRLIVTLPGRTVEEARRELEEARAAGADIAELRVDRWAVAERSRVGELFPSPIPLLATYRSRAEGGEGSDDPETRRRALEELARHPFQLIDREIARDVPVPGSPGGSPGWIASRHLPDGGSPEDVGRALRIASGDAEFVKVVVPSSVGDALGRLRAVLPPPEGARFVFHTTGASGPLYRAWAWRLGFPAVYASLPQRAGRPPVEPAQIPVDRLRHYLDGPVPGPLFGLVGHPVGHSRSPEIYHGWMRAHGDRGLYMALDIPSENELAESVPALAASGFRGINVTRPWKQAALDLASRIGPGAGPCGCANVLTITPGGGIEAENTDLAAILRRLRELLEGSQWDGRSATVVGSGGAARAALAALRSLGSEATVVARDLDAAARIASDFGAEAAAVPAARLPELLINTTPVGRREAGPPGVDFARWIAEGGRVLDLVYSPEDPIVRNAARSRRSSYEDGWRLLVYQAAESYALWWGAPPEDSDIQRILRVGA
jgi:shikimate dehydrogenase